MQGKAALGEVDEAGMQRFLPLNHDNVKTVLPSSSHSAKAMTPLVRAKTL